MIILEVLILISDVFIAYYVAKEYYESKETNRVLVQVLNKQRKQKKKVSVDRIIKAATLEAKSE